MKIGVLTFHRSYNNGAILQAYALVNTLCQLGAEAEIIDFRNKAIEEPTRLVLKGEKFNIKLPFKVIFRYIRHKKADRFIKKNIPLSKPVVTDADFKNIEGNYNAFVTGSDQVWNDTHIKSNKCFFLDFVVNSDKKYSYAASIGGNLDKAKETVKLYDKFIRQYRTISLRESNIEGYFKEIYGSKVRCDIDPVFLPSKQQWIDLASQRLHKRKYIFMYLVPTSEHIRKFAENLAKKYDCDLIDNKTSKEFFNNCGVDDFLSWFYNAEVIVTNSFHGTAFSIIFEKEFYVEMESNIGFNYRVNQILKAVDIDFNSVNITSDYHKNKVVHDYKNVSLKLNEIKNKSIDYLKEIVMTSNTEDYK